MSKLTKKQKNALHSLSKGQVLSVEEALSILKNNI